MNRGRRRRRKKFTNILFGKIKHLYSYDGYTPTPKTISSLSLSLSLFLFQSILQNNIFHLGNKSKRHMIVQLCWLLTLIILSYNRMGKESLPHGQKETNRINGWSLEIDENRNITNNWQVSLSAAKFDQVEVDRNYAPSHSYTSQLNIILLLWIHC